jgi:hypothetical protein
MMPKGPQGQKRPADVVGNAVHVMRIATGEIDEPGAHSSPEEKARRAGIEGGKARAVSLTAKRRSQIATTAAKSRWAKAKEPTE